jgi:hypothetical protein
MFFVGGGGLCPVDIVTGYGLEIRASIPGSGKMWNSILQRPDRHWDPASLLTKEYPGALSPDLHLVLRLKTVEPHLHIPHTSSWHKLNS